MGRASRRRRALLAASTPQPSRAPRSEAERQGPVEPFEAWHGVEDLSVLCEERRLLDLRIEARVLALSRLGVSWAEIGRALGMSRQGARQRYG